MKINMYTIYDSQAKRAIQPFARDNDDVAMRDFTDGVHAADSPFNKHSQDYTLYHCGEWDDETMTFTPITEATRILNGADAKRKRQIDLEKIADLEAQINKINGQADEEPLGIFSATQAE